MKIKLFVICFIIFYLNNCAVLFAQSKAKIQNVDFELVNDELIITYDIAYFKPNEKFNISVNIFKSQGKKINANSFSGDINNISGGYNKKIIWHIKNDNVYFDEDIYVEILAEVISPDISKQSVKAGKMKSAGRGGAFFMSAIYPGWGTSKMTLKNANLTKGFLAYGCVALSVYFNQEAVSYSDDYKESSDEQERNSLYNDAQQNDKISKIFAAGAATIWAIDLITVLSVKNKSKNTAFLNHEVTVGYSFNSVVKAPVLSLKYNF